MAPHGPGPHPSALELARQFLDGYPKFENATSDPGIPVLASLVARAGDPAAAASARRGAAPSSRCVRPGRYHRGLELGRQGGNHRGR
ncbi:hypothetical protein ACFV01_21905, partial [Streptomyces sp. NPDC059616]